MNTAMFGVFLVIQILLLLELCLCYQEGICDRRPLGTNTEPLAPDNQFQIEIKDIRDNLYIPRHRYDVRLFAKDSAHSFIAFSIFLGPDSIYNKENPRRPILLNPGVLELYHESNNAVRSRTCNNTIIQSDITPKKEVKVQWVAPIKDNKCVTIFAVVAVQPDVWYTYEGPLSKKVCEDIRKADDMMPVENSNCQACVDARYQMTFEGKWTPNTHPTMYPPSKELARFSDIVGASHSKELALYKISFEASEGIKMLAEQGNTTQLEIEILDWMSPNIEKSYVRTLIKASAPPQPNTTTVASFRVTERHHMVTLATALLPSPDWFLGVSNLELCDAYTNKWAPRVSLNLYPFDAGTDSGKTFESANEATAPPQPIKDAVIDKNISKDMMKPFARVVFELIRTYVKANCSSDPSGSDEPATTDENQGEDNSGEEPEGGGDGGEEQPEPEYRPQPQPQPTTTTSEEPASVDPETEQSQCPMTTWGEWEPCEGDCIDNRVTGYHTRFRTHVVDPPTPDCIAKMPTEDFQQCEEDCKPEAEEEGDEEEENEEET